MPCHCDLPDNNAQPSDFWSVDYVCEGGPCGGLRGRFWLPKKANPPKVIWVNPAAPHQIPASVQPVEYQLSRISEGTLARYRPADTPKPKGKMIVRPSKTPDGFKQVVFAENLDLQAMIVAVKDSRVVLLEALAHGGIYWRPLCYSGLNGSPEGHDIHVNRQDAVRWALDWGAEVFTFDYPRDLLLWLGELAKGGGQ